MKMYATRNTVAAAVVFSVLSGLSSLSSANLSHIDIASVRVNFADLNLADTDAAATLYTRLRRAAAHVCDDFTRKSLNELVEAKECKEATLNRAIREVGSRQLTTLHQG